MDEFHSRKADAPAHDIASTRLRYNNCSQKGTWNHSREFEVIVLVNLDSVIKQVMSGLDIETLFYFCKGT